jgi:hypothetical protein
MVACNQRRERISERRQALGLGPQRKVKKVMSDGNCD